MNPIPHPPPPPAAPALPEAWLEELAHGRRETSRLTRAELDRLTEAAWAETAAAAPVTNGHGTGR